MSMRYTLYNNHLLFSLFLWSCLSIFLIKSDSFLLSLYQRNQLMVTTSSWLNNCWSKFDLKKSACLFFKRIRQAIILKRRNNIQTEHNNNDTVRFDWDINAVAPLHSFTASKPDHYRSTHPQSTLVIFKTSDVTLHWSESKGADITAKSAMSYLGLV